MSSQENGEKSSLEMKMLGFRDLGNQDSEPWSVSLPRSTNQSAVNNYTHNYFHFWANYPYIIISDC